MAAVRGSGDLQRSITSWAVWALRSLRTSFSNKGKPTLMYLKRLDRWIRDTHGWGSRYERVQQASGTLSHTCVLMCAQVYCLTGTCHIHMNICTECTSVHGHMLQHRCISVHKPRYTHTYLGKGVHHTRMSVHLQRHTCRLKCPFIYST